jgi:hypothetical protein
MYTNTYMGRLTYMGMKVTVEACVIDQVTNGKKSRPESDCCYWRKKTLTKLGLAHNRTDWSRVGAA